MNTEQRIAYLLRLRDEDRDLRRIVEHSEKNRTEFIGISTDVVKKLIKVAEAAKDLLNSKGFIYVCGIRFGKSEMENHLKPLAQALEELEGE